ncbi:DUF7507 domain-containing protein [Nitratireductor luteus]|uniref:DUF7507 domain-containing protein n=1 Tax=Nitratireductor luteus TaxID=2976980 RepID=UPI00308405F8
MLDYTFTVENTGNVSLTDVTVTDSRATVRADLHIVKNWDALVEGRAFYTPTIKSADYGFLAALYRHVGNNFKVGAGYNFGRFSDDLRDLTLDDKGPFLNVVGKF